MKEYVAAFLLIASFVLREVWLLFPDPERMIKPFVLREDIEISLAYYAYFYSYYASNLIITAAMLLFIKRLHLFFNILFILQMVEVVDYYLTYNTAWFEAFGINVGITIVKVIVLTVTLLTQWIHISLHRSPLEQRM